MDIFDVFTMILGLPVLLSVYFLARRRASVYDNPHLLPEEPTWIPTYNDIAQAEKIGSTLQKVCVISKERERFAGSDLGELLSDEESWSVPSYSASDLLRDVLNCIRTQSLEPMRNLSEPTLNQIESRWCTSFGVTLDGETLDLKQGGSNVERHARWLASRLSIECEIAQ